MPFYRVQLRLACYAAATPYKFSYNFRIEAPVVLGAANAVKAGWIDGLRDAHNQAVAAYEVYASDETPDTTTFVTVPFSNDDRSGTSTTGSGGEVMPSWNCLRVEFPAGAAWPMVKYHRFPLFESFSTNGTTVSPALITEVQAGWFTFVASTPWVDNQGEAVGPASQVTLTSKRLGKLATVSVPLPPV